MTGLVVLDLVCPSGRPTAANRLIVNHISVLLDLPDLVVFNSDGCPESHPCGFLATQRSEGQKYPRQTDAAADKFLPYAAEEQ